MVRQIIKFSAKEGHESYRYRWIDRLGFTSDHWESEQIRLTTSEATNPSLNLCKCRTKTSLEGYSPKTLKYTHHRGGR